MNKPSPSHTLFREDEDDSLSGSLGLWCRLLVAVPPRSPGQHTARQQSGPSMVPHSPRGTCWLPSPWQQVQGRKWAGTREEMGNLSRIFLGEDFGLKLPGPPRVTICTWTRPLSNFMNDNKRAQGGGATNALRNMILGYMFHALVQVPCLISHVVPWLLTQPPIMPRSLPSPAFQ